jgi:hypothetical protein
MWLTTTCTTFHGQMTRCIRKVQNIFQHSTTLSAKTTYQPFTRTSCFNLQSLLSWHGESYFVSAVIGLWVTSQGRFPWSQFRFHGHPWLRGFGGHSKSWFVSDVTRPFSMVTLPFPWPSLVTGFNVVTAKVGLWVTSQGRFPWSSLVMGFWWLQQKLVCDVTRQVSKVIPDYGVLVVTAKVGLWVMSQARFLSCQRHFVYTETWRKSTSFNDRTTRW